jgi:hypothetical protein
MAIDRSRTRIEKSREVPMLSTVLVNQEGLVLQNVFEQNLSKARPSNATAGSEFLGFSWGIRYGAPATSVMVETIIADSTGTINTSYPLAGAATTGVFPGGFGSGTAELTSIGSAPTASQYSINAQGYPFTNVSNAGVSYLVVYTYNLTVGQQQAKYGDTFPGQNATAAYQSVGMITGGYVYTDQFDPTVDWSVVISDSSGTTELTGGTNGLVTIGGTGCLLTNYAQVHELPSVTSPWLGLYIDR